MKILGIMGSPRVNGNTDTILTFLLDAAREAKAQTEKLVLEDLSFSACSAKEYDNISENGYPLVKDDIYLIIERMLWADSIILASPIFFGSLSAQVKMMIDRFQFVWLAKSKKSVDLFKDKRRGAFLCCEATERVDFFENASSIVRHFFATCNVDYTAEVFCDGVEAKDDVKKRSDLLEESSRIGRSLASDGKH